jgi:hypothetical protein
MKRSTYGRINGADILNALYHAVLAASGAITVFLSKGKFPEAKGDWYVVLGVFIAAIIGDLSKRTATNSNGEVWRRDSQQKIQS